MSVEIASPSLLLRYTYAGCPYPGLHVHSRSACSLPGAKPGLTYVERISGDVNFKRCSDVFADTQRLVVCSSTESRGSYALTHVLVRTCRSADAASAIGDQLKTKLLQSGMGCVRWFLMDAFGNVTPGS